MIWHIIKYNGNVSIKALNTVLMQWKLNSTKILKVLPCLVSLCFAKFKVRLTKPFQNRSQQYRCIKKCSQRNASNDEPRPLRNYVITLNSSRLICNQLQSAACSRKSLSKFIISMSRMFRLKEKFSLWHVEAVYKHWFNPVKPLLIREWSWLSWVGSGPNLFLWTD